MTEREAKERIDSAEFGRWMAEYSIEPWGDRRGDYHAGLVVASRLGGKPLDYIPKWGEPKKDAAKAEDAKAALEGIAKKWRR